MDAFVGPLPTLGLTLRARLSTTRCSGRETKTPLTLTFLSLQKTHFCKFNDLDFLHGGGAEDTEWWALESSILSARDASKQSVGLRANLSTMGGELSVRADMSDRKGAGRRPSRMLNLCLEVGRSEVVTNPEA